MSRTYIVAEIGSCHNGRLTTARSLIQAAAKAGADAAKAQLFLASHLCHPSHPAYKTVKANELPRKWLPHLKAEAKEAGIDFSATPFDLEAVDLLDALDVGWIKISSGDLTYLPLIRKAAQTGRRLFISTGAATDEEVFAACQCARGVYLTLLQCSIAYPCKPNDVNLRAMADRDMGLAFQHYSSGRVGFSDHTLSLTLPAVAVGLGATVIEKHFTLDRNQPGPDHGHSLEPDEFRQMVDAIREAEVALGDGEKRPLECEMEMRTLARRSPYMIDGEERWLRPAVTE